MVNVRKAHPQIERLRMYKGSLRALAREAGLSHTTLLRISCGEVADPRISTIERIQKALDARSARPFGEPLIDPGAAKLARQPRLPARLRGT